MFKMWHLDTLTLKFLQSGINCQSTKFPTRVISSTTCCVTFFFLGLSLDLIRVLVDRDVGVGSLSIFFQVCRGSWSIERWWGQI